FDFDGRLLVILRRAQAVRPERGDSEEYESIVPAEEGQVVRTPQVSVIAACTRGGNEGDIHETESRGVLEQQAEQVTPIENVRTALVTERSVLHFIDVEVPGVARHREVVFRCADEPEQLIGRDPTLRRAPGKRAGDSLS